jgi:hypothetical protein
LDYGQKLTGRGSGIRSADLGPTVLLIDHTSGPGVHIQSSYSGIRNVHVLGSAARLAAGHATMNDGVRVEPYDAVDGAVDVRNRMAELFEVTSSRHGRHGFYVASPGYGKVFTRISADNNGGCGLAWDAGTDSDRVNPLTNDGGFCHIESPRMSTNGGPGIAIGHPGDGADAPWRISINQHDCSDNNEDSSVYSSTYGVHENDQIFIRARNSSITNGGHSGRMVLWGQYLYYKNNRHLNWPDTGAAFHCIRIKADATFETKGVFIEGMQPASAGMDPAVACAAGDASFSSGIRVVQPNMTNITNLITTSVADGVFTRPLPVYAASNVTPDRTYNANSTTTDELADVLGTLISDLRVAGIVR